ncbi:uncharacterized protein PpBr36_10051 [Pyricularia pennisetigena]|uniref:uncharacterized protein n=1 Tax=Pyricularia pennisetigena TaxID=1578925 RepID=UPI0011544E7B|nr:uncharacterized protein PpBr36_10051 [Pyricularia pennisetigena]TLS22226.1 hypothetical protein PpBr36_10051 [Pyricularia pennisetigena]
MSPRRESISSTSSARSDESKKTDASVQKKQSKLRWYSEDDTPRERRFIAKLDIILIPYVFLAYAVKAIDGVNLSNAYVAGMKEDQRFFGNELVQLQTIYTLGAVLGMIPFIYLFTCLPMQWSIPMMDVFRALFTMCQCRADSFVELAAYRFCIGFFEGAFYPAMSYVLGSWYRGSELARRGGLSSIGVNVGNMSAGLIAAGVTQHLQGYAGITAWRWIYIICGIMTFPVAIMGFFLLPGTVAQPNRWILADDDIETGKKRLERDGHVVAGKFKLAILPKILNPKNVRFWTVVLVNLLFWNAGIHKSVGGYLLWIKSLNRYNATEINQLGSIAPALGIAYTLIASFASDLLLGPMWTIVAASLFNASGLVILVIWDVPEGMLWYAFSTMFWSSSIAGVLGGWVNSLLRDSPSERSFTIIMVTIISQLTVAGTPLATFPTVEGPRFPKGYAFCLGCALALIVAAFVLNLYLKREEEQKAAAERSVEEGLQEKLDDLDRPDTPDSVMTTASTAQDTQQAVGSGQGPRQTPTTEMPRRFINYSTNFKVPAPARLGPIKPYTPI